VKRLVAFVSLSITTTVAALVMASSGSRIAILVRPSVVGPDAELEALLRSELLAEGFEVLTIAQPVADDTTLEAVARRTDSIAVIVVAEPNGELAANVWMRDRVAGKTALRQVRPEPMAPGAPSIIAIRAAELLRASLLELSEAHPARAEAPAEVLPGPRPQKGLESTAPAPIDKVENVEAITDRHRAAWLASAGGALVGGPGGLSAGLAPVLAIGWHASPNWVTEFNLIGPTMQTVTTGVGSAKVDQELVTTRLRFEMPSVNSRFIPFAMLGIGAYHLGARGTAADPYLASSGHVWAAIATGGLGLRIRVAPAVSLGSELDAFVAAPRPVLRFAGQDSFYTGRPDFVAAIGCEIAW
jgi:hypothetical protein